jgi:hypothetical protein
MSKSENASRAFLVVGEVVLRDAANRQRERRRAVRLSQHHGRHGFRDIRRRDGTELLEIFTAHGGDRDAHILGILGALLRGDDDFFENSGRRRR